MPDVLSLLVAERDRLNRAIEILGGSRPGRRGRKPKSLIDGLSTSAATGKKRGRKAMSAAARKAVSQRMKKYWAARRKAKKK